MLTQLKSSVISGFLRKLAQKEKNSYCVGLLEDPSTVVNIGPLLCSPLLLRAESKPLHFLLSSVFGVLSMRRHFGTLPRLLWTDTWANYLVLDYVSVSYTKKKSIKTDL